MLRTRVGYAGGKKDKPTYRSIGDHTEAIQIEFDPARIRFEKLLAIFWKAHDPCSAAGSTQYKAVLWTHGAGQARIARSFVARWERKHGREAKTAILPAPRFWIAEDYHQKYYLRGRKALLAALFETTPTGEEIRESTVTARVNGWIAGHGSAAEIAAEIEALALSTRARAALEKALGPRSAATAR